MPDTYPREVRSRVMAQVKGRDTKPEVTLRKALFSIGIRGWRCHRKDLPGNPDLVFGPRKVVVFVDGAFWHGHPDKYWPGRSGPYWDAKIERNMERDRRVNKELKRAGWKVIRIWDFEVLRDPLESARRVERELRQRVSNST